MYTNISMYVMFSPFLEATDLGESQDSPHGGQSWVLSVIRIAHLSYNPIYVLSLFNMALGCVLQPWAVYFNTITKTIFWKKGHLQILWHFQIFWTTQKIRKCTIHINLPGQYQQVKTSHLILSQFIAIEHQNVLAKVLCWFFFVLHRSFYILYWPL